MKDLKFLENLFYWKIPWPVLVWLIIVGIFFYMLPRNFNAICSALGHENGIYIIVADLVLKALIIPSFIFLVRNIKHYMQHDKEMSRMKYNAIPADQANRKLEQVIREEARKAIQEAARSINENQDT